MTFTTTLQARRNELNEELKAPRLWTAQSNSHMEERMEVDWDPETLVGDTKVRAWAGGAAQW